jgi:hypothetical protein
VSVAQRGLALDEALAIDHRAAAGVAVALASSAAEGDTVARCAMLPRSAPR